MIADLRRLRAEVGELVAKHETARDLRDFSKYADDPEGFFRDVLHCAPWEKQVEMTERVRDNPRTICVTANGLGKDWATARLCLWYVYARKGFVILSGPTERQVKQILMREIRRAFAVAQDLPGELYAMELRVTEDSGIIAFTSDNADKLTGFHHPRLLICYTEGQGIPDEAYEAAFACCTGTDNKIFVYGNPTTVGGKFHQAATSDNWSILTIRADEHPNVITGRNEIEGAVSREWIESMREEYGESSSIYRSRVLAEFPEENVEGLLKRAWLRSAFDRHESKELEAASWNHRLVLAVDVARYGPDSSVMAVVRGPVVEELITWRGASLTDSADRVIEHAQRLTVYHANPKFEYLSGPPKIVVDEPGMGGGVIDVMRKKGWVVTAFNGAGKSIDQRRYLNMRAASHWKLRELLEANQIALPRDAALEEEALSVEWQHAPNGTIQIVSKDLIRKTLGRSPDRLDAVIMGLANNAIGGLFHSIQHFTLHI
jgi:phage terminase large subunit